MIINRSHIEYHVKQATDASDGTYDNEAIVAEIVDKYGMVDIDTIEHDDFWDIVIKHAID